MSGFASTGGRIVEASADTHEDFLIETIDSDEGARRLGELGIGCNPGITRYMKNTLFDEKIDGTVHLALGHGFPNLGGTNESQIHWDIVKDLRPGLCRPSGFARWDWRPNRRRSHRARRRGRAGERRLADLGRVARYADLLVDACLRVQPGWEVLVLGPPAARPLYEELGRALARRGAYAVFQLSLDGGIGAINRSWLRLAPDELLPAGRRCCRRTC